MNERKHAKIHEIVCFHTIIFTIDMIHICWLFIAARQCLAVGFLLTSLSAFLNRELNGCNKCDWIEIRKFFFSSPLLLSHASMHYPSIMCGKCFRSLKCTLFFIYNFFPFFQMQKRVCVEWNRNRQAINKQYVISHVLFFSFFLFFVLSQLNSLIEKKINCIKICQNSFFFSFLFISFHYNCRIVGRLSEGSI